MLYGHVSFTLGCIIKSVWYEHLDILFCVRFCPVYNILCICRPAKDSIVNRAVLYFVSDTCSRLAVVSA